MYLRRCLARSFESIDRVSAWHQDCGLGYLQARIAKSQCLAPNCGVTYLKTRINENRKIAVPGTVLNYSATTSGIEVNVLMFTVWI